MICGFWDWFLYFSPFKNKLHKYKMNQKYPSWRQFQHDAFYTTLTSCWATVIEILLCHWWASGTLTWQPDLTERPIRNAVVALTLTHLRIPHFHLTHRLMHPWKTRHVPDVGKFLYKHVHSLHHKVSLTQSQYLLTVAWVSRTGTPCINPACFISTR